MIPVASFEIAKYFKRNEKFDINGFVAEKYPQYNDWPDKKLLKIGQKVIVLKEDKEIEKIKQIDFQTKRLYIIEQFSDGSIWLKYHLEADPDSVELNVKQSKDDYFKKLEKENNLPEIQEDSTIKIKIERNKDLEKRKYSFNSIQDYRPSRLVPILGEKKVKEIIKDLRNKFATRPSKLGQDVQASLLKISKENWNFLYEYYDFEISMLGELKWKNK